MNSNLKNKFSQLQRQNKRRRIRESDEDDSSILQEEDVQSNEEEILVDVEDINSSDEDIENEVEFEEGTTQMHAKCLWHLGYRYLHNRNNTWRCSHNKPKSGKCPTTAIASKQEDGTFRGRIFKQHNHLPAPDQQMAEEKRQNIRQKVRADPKKKPALILTEAREKVELLVYARMGSDHALEQVVQREKGKLFGNVNIDDVLNIQLPAALMERDRQSMLLFDSRTTRIGQRDVVLCVAHPQLLNIMKKCRTMSADCTFSVAPRQWKQCLVVGGYVKKRLITVMHALLPGKSKKYYVEALTSFKNAITMPNTQLPSKENPTMNSNLKNKFSQLQRQNKRRRIRESDEDDSSILQEEDVQSNEEEILVDVEDINSSDEDIENEVEFEEGTTQMHAKCLWHLGYRYLHNRNNTWRCSHNKPKSGKCPTTAIASKQEDGTFRGRIFKQHNHLPAPDQQMAEEKRQNIRQKVRADPKKKPALILTEAREKVELLVYARMGSDHALEQVVQREKGKLFGNVNIDDVLNIQLPAALMERDRQSMLLFDSRTTRIGQRDVVLCVAHPQLLNIMKKCRTMSADCTFSVAPRQWKQCLVVGGYVKKRLITVMHALLPGKSKKYYVEALTSFKNAITMPNTQLPSKVMTDFEKPLINAFSDVFTGIEKSGCHFHWAQALFRKWRSMGLDQLHTDPEHGQAIRIAFGRILSLPIIPIQHVRRAFYMIVANSPPGLSAFYAYFAGTYLGLSHTEVMDGSNAFLPEDNDATTIQNDSGNTLVDTTNNTYEHDYTPRNIQFGRPSPAPPSLSFSSIETAPIPRWEQPIARRPNYEIGFWNLHQNAISDIARTNNSMEATHNEFSKRLNHHPSLSDFLMCIKENIGQQLRIWQSALLGETHRRHRKYVIKEQQIQRILQHAIYDGNEVMDVLDLISAQSQDYVDGLRIFHPGQNAEDDGEMDDSSLILSPIPSPTLLNENDTQSPHSASPIIREFLNFDNESFNTTPSTSSSNH